jgi:hypothetical protein
MSRADARHSNILRKEKAIARLDAHCSYANGNLCLNYINYHENAIELQALRISAFYSKL